MSLFLFSVVFHLNCSFPFDMDTSASPKKNVHTDTLKFINSVFFEPYGWLAIYPNNEDAALKAPSTTASNYTIDDEVPESVRHHLHDGMLRVFQDHLLNNVHLDSTIRGIDRTAVSICKVTQRDLHKGGHNFTSTECRV